MGKAGSARPTLARLSLAAVLVLYRDQYRIRTHAFFLPPCILGVPRGVPSPPRWTASCPSCTARFFNRCAPAPARREVHGRLPRACLLRLFWYCIENNALIAFECPG